MKRNRHIVWHENSDHILSIKDKQIAIVGGTGGIGRALSQHLASQGANVTVVGQTFRDQKLPNIKFIKADLSLMAEAKRVTTLLMPETLDMLIFTTGIFAAPHRQETQEGIEKDLAVSYLNRFVMLQNMADRLGTQRKNTSMKPRIFLMGYPGSGQMGNIKDLNSEITYKPMATHMTTVAGNEILVLNGAKTRTNTLFFGLNPGLIKTNIRDNFLGKGSLKSRLMEGAIGWFTPTAESYAKRIVPLLFSLDIDKYNGTSFNHKGQGIFPSAGLSEAYSQEFLLKSQKLLERQGIQSKLNS
ncbi:SDR family NAD(P)-dependent oxidoreductase [Acinetobacter sp. HY1485]|uniref:SDR family NAD(P)-dependent oxidoreductase n=1 Tax=Acinetobacter sp. HY1485 TaxID=2970918 RepID=UPI0022B95B86|nr:SDR family NAD(P)-dependent oxidoreductase [Acinetobacter sp. HY1485]